MSTSDDEQVDAHETEYLPATETRLARLAHLHLTCTIKHGTTYPQLAEEWGVSVQRVHQLSTIAAKRVRDQLRGPKASAKILATMDALLDDATPAVRLKVCELYAKVIGELPREQQTTVVQAQGTLMLPDNPKDRAQVFAMLAEAESKRAG